MNTQKAIEHAYRQKYNKNIKWCTPDEEVNEFRNINELNSYIESNIGFRLYGKIGDSYIICEYRSPIQIFLYQNLCYGDIELINNAELFNTQYSYTYIYANNSIEKLEDNNLQSITCVYDENELNAALEIKTNNEKYIEKYFSKFMDFDENLNDTYLRLYNSLKN